MTFKIEYQRAKLAGQEHIFSFYKDLSSQEKEELVLEARTLDYTLLEKLFKQTQESQEKDFSSITSPKITHCFDNNEKNRELKLLGKSIITNGELALFTVAGGQGSRLGYDGPKGCYPITPIKKKSLFELFADKIKSANKKYNTRFDWYIMTSLSNDSQTKKFFNEHNYFGLYENIVFFSQDMMPALDQEGKLLLENKHKIFMSPNGTGGIYEALVNNNIINRMKNKNIKYLSYFQIDNPLSVFVDEGFLGNHIQANTEFSTKVVRKVSWDEKVGILANNNNKVVVVEYTQMSEKQAKKINSDGSLAFSAGNIALHIINRDFIEFFMEKDVGIYTPAHKKINYLNSSGDKIVAEKPNAYKFERFVFDALAQTHNSAVFEVKREEEFAPTKNATGVDSALSAIQLQVNLGKSWMKSAGFSREFLDSLKLVEIDPLFALTREDFVKKVFGRTQIYELSKEDEVYFKL